MKKRSAKKETKFRRLFNKMGMTYVELICALALLSLIVVMFTPMLLSSYETLYAAGEKVEGVYDSKEEIEENLATRYSVNPVSISDYKLTTGVGSNLQQLFVTLNVGGKKIVSSFQQGLETVFGTTRASVDIVSPDIVYDNQSNHDVVIQTSGLEYSKVIFGKYAKYGDIATGVADEKFAEEAKKTEGGLIFIEVLIPDKDNATKSEEAFYKSDDNNLANLKFKGQATYALSNYDGVTISHKDNNGRISFNVAGRNIYDNGTSDLDFTRSPLRITIYYVNTRGIVKTVSDFLTIEPATMIFAGETDGSVDYYTSAGVEEKDVVVNGVTKTQYGITFEPRKMRVDNSELLGEGDTLKSTKSSINTVLWVENDENSYFKPYYVMAGTDGSVYRMYNYKLDTTLSAALGSKNSVNGTTDGTISISDGSLVTPSFWSGEMSDQYSFQSMYHAATYGAAKDNDIDCSAPNDSNSELGKDHKISLIGTQYNKFDTRLRYSMVFNAYRMGYSYASQMSRKISYVLTEAGKKSFRIGGKKHDEPDFIGYHIPWEATSAESSDKQNHYTTFEGGLFSANTDTELTVYLGGFGAGAATNAHTDMHLAYLRLNSYTSINPLEAVKDTKKYKTTNGDDTTIYDRLITGGEFWSPPGKNEEDLKGMEWKDRVNYISTDYACKTNISSIAYLPGSSSSGKGQVIYFGSVPAYALMRQSSDYLNGQENVYNTDTARAKNSSAATVYFLCGSQGEGTTIYRNAYNYYTKKEWNGAVKETNYYSQGVDVQDKIRTQINDDSYTTKTDANEFYTLGNDTHTYKIFDSDLEFTFGYCSRWRMTVGDVTYNGTTEETKSYEKYYKASRPNANYIRKPSTINAGGTDNIYYNVWFPGEFYNLTQCVTVDEVTVAVGYTVSGSSFMEESAYSSGYYGTALGSVYNDGVLAAYVSEDAGGTVFTSNLADKGVRNTIFQNLLYYKSPSFINGTLHSRQSVRFTAVGLYASTDKINTEVQSQQTVTKEYVAFYGDSLGNAYYSTIATSSVTGKNVEKTDPDTGKKYTEWVSEESGVNLRSEEAKNALKARAYDANKVLQDYDMHPIKIGDKELSTYFTEITTIVAEEGLLVLSGKPRGSTELLVVGYTDDNGNWTFKMVNNYKFSGYINHAEFIGNYYYFVGGDSNGGWCAAINKDRLIELAKASSGTTDATWSKIEPSNTDKGNTTTDPKKLIYFETPTIIKSFDGRVTQS